jgi:hypothetical protein
MSRSPELDRQLESLKRTLADKTDLPVLLGRAGMNHDGGICTCGEAPEALRVPGYATSNRAVSASQARTSCGRMASFGFRGIAPSR